MAGETFELRFKNNEDVTVSIDEPINFATVDFQLSQKDKGYGRDVSFNGGEVQFEFVKYRNHYLDKLLLYNNTYGFESIVELIITCGTITTIIGELDFATAITDDLEYFKCKVIQQSSKQIVKRRKSVKVDLLSDKNIDGNAITPLAPKNTLLSSKPIYQNSKWESPRAFGGGEDSKIYTFNYNESSFHDYYYLTFAINLVHHSLETALTAGVIQTRDARNITYLTATTDLKNIVIDIPATNFSWYYDSDTTDKTCFYQFIVEYGATVQVLKSNSFTPNETFSFGDAFQINIPSLSTGQSIKIYHKLDFDMPNLGGYYGSWMYVTSGLQTITISAESTTFKSIAPSFRLIDVMRQVVKSISGLDISAPRFDVGGEFYDNRLLNGNSLRAISTKPFYVSLEDLEKSLVELNVDWEISEYLVDDVLTTKIFFGTEDDFYVDTPSWEFTNTQFSSFNKSFNPRFSINEFNYGYKNFQSLKENEELNSSDVIHGESKWVLGNKMVENKKDISIEWIRDAFLMETNRRKALSEKVDENTASQDDDKLFAADTYSTTSDVTINQQYSLAHNYDLVNGILSLINDTSINFTVTGIRKGSYFQIVAPSVNQNIYTVDSVSPTTIKLIKVSGSVTPASYTTLQAGITSFTYKLTVTDIPYTIYTDAGFTNLDNLIASNLYSNLRYSIRRNIEKYWKKYIATCNLYNKTQGLSSTWYKNNPYFSSTYSGLTLTEREVIDTYAVNPILTPFLYNDVIFSNVEFSDFIALQDSIRTNRGYIKTKDNSGNDLNLYPTTMKYDNLSKELNIRGEEKYTPTTLVQIAPILTTNSASSITGSSAVSGGYIKTNGGSAITSKGIVWSTSANPTTALTTKTNDGIGSVDYKSSLSGLYPSKKYYIRAYAINGVNTSYGNQVEFEAGYDGVTIGSQTWANKNLNVSTYSDGTLIPNVTSQTDWNNATIGAWCWSNHDSSVEQPYGKLYNWYAIAGIHDLASLTDPSLRKKIAPDGWRVPSVTDFNTLITTAGGSSTAGKKLKSTSWTNSPNIPLVTGTDNYGFTAFGGGYRDIVPASPIPFYFKDFQWRGRFWTTTAQNSTNSSYVQLYADSDFMLVDNAGVNNKLGMSARLIKE
jgi:uncharacterized protein (TIGR02145 family)